MNATKTSPSRGAMLRLAASLGLALRGSGPKRTLRCPLPGHDDGRASAVIFADTDRFHCSVCTPGRALSAGELAAALGAREPSPARGVPAWDVPARDATSRDAAMGFSAAEARAVWDTARARGLEGEAREATEDAEVHRYLASRGLAAARDLGALGILACSPCLPRAIAAWPARGYRLVLPLHAVATGDVVNLQARSIRSGAEPRTLLPAGSSSRGTVFATPAGVEVLRAERTEVTVILAEGLTDHIALTIHARAPVLSAPGASAAVHTIGAWARGRRLIVALDRDSAGDAAAARVATRAHLLGAARVERATWPAPAKDACDALAMLGPERFAETLRTWVERSP